MAYIVSLVLCSKIANLKFLVRKYLNITLLPPTVGETSCLTGQLPLDSIWAAPSQLGAGPPTSACFSGSLKLIVLDMTSECYSAPGKQKKASKKFPALRFANWNVRTMFSGLSEDLQQIADTRKTAIIDRELLKLDVSIAVLQKTRF